MAAKTYDRSAVWSWAFYDFANSPFTTLVVTFVFATYFTEVVAPGALSGAPEEIRARATGLWTRGISLSAVLIAILSPPLGALADRGGYRKPFLLLFTAICIGSTVALYGVLPGTVVAGLAWFVVANVSFEMAGVFYNAFLPDIAPPGRIGRVSGYGWGLGYVGGLLALVVGLVALVLPEQPWLGFSTEAHENVRATNLLVAAWFAVFSLPIFLVVKEDRSRISQPGRVLADSFRQLAGTFAQVRRYRQVIRFLIARLVYNDALITIFAMGGIYAAGTFGFTVREVMIFGIAINVAAGLGAFAMGYLDDLLGGKRTVAISLWGLTGATLLAMVAPSRPLFWVAAIAVGIFSGPNQAASRSLMGRFVPAEKENEFFGFFAFSGKFTSFLGPLLFGLLTEAFRTQRAGVAAIVVLFALGGLLLRFVDEEEGKRVAAQAAPELAAVL